MINLISFFRFATMARVLSDLLHPRKKSAAKFRIKRSENNLGGVERGNGKRKIVKTNRFEFGDGHTLFSESTRRHEKKVENRIYMESFRARQSKIRSSEQKIELKVKQLEKTVKKQTEMIKKMKETNKMKIKKIRLENRKLKKRNTSSIEE